MVTTGTVSSGVPVSRLFVTLGAVRLVPRLVTGPSRGSDPTPPPSKPTITGYVDPETFRMTTDSDTE